MLQLLDTLKVGKVVEGANVEEAKVELVRWVVWLGERVVGARVDCMRWVDRLGSREGEWKRREVWACVVVARVEVGELVVVAVVWVVGSVWGAVEVGEGEREEVTGTVDGRVVEVYVVEVWVSVCVVV